MSQVRTTPFFVGLPDPLDALTVAEQLLLPPFPRMLALAAPPHIRWCRHGVRRLAERVAGRLLDLDALPRALADALLVEALAVLDWVGAA